MAVVALKILYEYFWEHWRIDLIFQKFKQETKLSISFNHAIFVLQFKLIFSDTLTSFQLTDKRIYAIV